MEKHWKMTFDLNTLDHLGVKLYKHYEPIIAELLSNSWDADGTKVDIELFDLNEKKIVIKDNGNGMDAGEVQNNFLKIGRNRRISDGQSNSLKYGRPVLGKKGIGKLSMFGLANRIRVQTVKNGYRNTFEMSYLDIKNAENGVYTPSEIEYNIETKESEGTVIELLEIKRASSFSFSGEDLAKKLSRRFSIFDNENFDVSIYRNGEFVIKVENKLKYENIVNEFSWNIPKDFKNEVELKEVYEYLVKNDIQGELHTSQKTLSKNLQGITFISRGKLAEENVFFVDRATDYFHDYFYGELNVDFIDENDNEDNISTDRKSILWDEEKPRTLKEKMTQISNYLQKEWRKKRKKKKEDEIKKTLGFNVDEWQLTLNAFEKPLAQELIKVIIENDKIDEKDGKKYFEHIKDVFSFESFKNFAAKLSEKGMLGDENVIKLLNDWEIIEAKELAKVAEGRIQTIADFKRFIDENASETKAIQPFFEKFPWVLDPKMNSFEREYTLGNAIKDNVIKKEALDNGANPLKRIDFFVTKNSDEFTIFELKTPNIKITNEMLSSVVHYITFTKNYLATETRNFKVKVVLITNNHKLNDDVKYMMDSMIAKGDLIFKTYNELLMDATKYHENFIKKYEDIMKIKNGNLN